MASDAIMSNQQTARDTVGSLQKGLDVIEVLAAHPAGLTLTEAAKETGLTRAGARRFLLTLVAKGYAVQSGRRFSLSPRLLSVARLWLEGTSLWAYAEPFMREVAASLNEACSIAVLSGEDIVYVARVPGPHVLSVALHLGSRLPAWCTSMGRVLLADLPEPQLEAFLAGVATLLRTPKTVTDRERLRAEIARVAQAGFAIIDEELEIGLRAIAVPIRDRTGRAVAAINASTHSSRHSCVAMERTFLPHLIRAARLIEDYFAVN
jgi:IclR family pca regulon transcriptional regulator